jgi:hypothetical protein
MRLVLGGRIASLKFFRAYADFQWKLESQGIVAVIALRWLLEYIFERGYERRGLVLRKFPSEDILFGELHKHRRPTLRIKGSDPFPVGRHLDFDDALDSRGTCHDWIERQLPSSDQRKCLIRLLSRDRERQHSTKKHQHYSRRNSRQVAFRMDHHHCDCAPTINFFRLICLIATAERGSGQLWPGRATRCVPARRGARHNASRRSCRGSA